MDESNKFFKRGPKLKHSALAEDREGDEDGLSPPFARSLPGSPKHHDHRPQNSTLQTAMLEEQQFKFQPHQNFREGEGGDQATEQNWIGIEQNLPASPDYNKGEDSFEKANQYTDQLKIDAQEAENFEKAGNSYQHKNSNLNSPKSVFKYLSHGLKNNSYPFVSGMGFEHQEGLVLPLPDRFDGWGGVIEESRKKNFKLNLINVDDPLPVSDQIAVPDLHPVRGAEARQKGDLFSSMVSDRSGRNDHP